jgi:hypothetical protein
MDKITQYEHEAPTMLAAAQSLDITTPEGERIAEEWLIKGREFCKRAEADLIEPWRNVKRDADCQMKKLKTNIIDPVANVVDTLRRRITDQRRRREIEAETERRRLQAEADARAEAERNRLIKQAEKLKTPELKQARIMEAETVVAPVIQVQTETPQTKLSMVTTWSFEIEDEAAIPREYMTPDMVKIGKIVRALKQGCNIPGIMVVRNESVR